MLAGAALQKTLDLVHLGRYVDRHVTRRIGSAISDYLVAFGIASIKINVVVQYALPLTIMCLFGIVYSVALLWFIGRLIYHNFWFERSIFVYGWNTGIVGIGIALVRVVDPSIKSKTLEDYGLAYLVISLVEIALLIVVPALVASGIIAVPALVLVGGFLVCLILSRTLVGWFPVPADAIREGEGEIIEEVHDAGSLSPDPDAAS
jgi:ESS family glutamate:Na+ symporter